MAHGRGSDALKQANSSVCLLFCMTCIKARKFRPFVSGFFVILILFLSFQLALSFNPNDNSLINTSKSLNPCEKCRIVVQSFIDGLKRTSRGKHEGGDAFWEEKRLLNYANSEIRLTEIQEHLCLEVPTGKDQCHSFAEEFESELEEWFFQHLKTEPQDQTEGTSLFDYLCNGIAKACCPEGHFGLNCEPCFGYPVEVCYGRGHCVGNGTRGGDGSCACFKGFTGKNCEKCAKNYFASGTIDKLVEQQVVQIPQECIGCDRSCDSSCHSEGPKGCHVCRKGFMWDNEHGCVDTNECAQMEINPCKESTYCANTQGSFKCLQCHKACKRSCTGPGDESCLECAEDYEMIDKKCIAKNTNYWYTFWSQNQYMIYVGLAIFTLLLTRIITFNESFSFRIRG